MTLKTSKEFFNIIEKLTQLQSSYKICEIAAVETFLVSKEDKEDGSGASFLLAPIFLFIKIK
jgi:hypothetical protein